MKIRVSINQQGMEVNEVFSGNNADEVVGAIKARVAKELNFALRIIVKGMSNLSFAQEVVKRYNESNNKNIPIPASCDEFLSTAQHEGLATLEP